MTSESLPDLAAILEGVKPQRSELLSALHKIQGAYGYVPREAITPLSRRLGTTPATLYGALTFYSEIRLKPMPEVDVAWCSGPACRLRGSVRILEALEAVTQLKLGEQRQDGTLGIRLIQCDGTCDQAPLLRVNGKTHGNLSAAGVIQLARELSGE